MGMAASQARFLGLTARRTNVEYEGQQINQQRTTLANQSANYYNQLLGMTVPTPPSTADFTKTVYTFEDGNLTNSITSLIAKPDGTYLASYTSSWVNDYTPVVAGTAVITQRNNYVPGVYNVGGSVLRNIAESYATTFASMRERVSSNNSVSTATGLTWTIGSQTFTLPADSNKLQFTSADGRYNDLELIWDNTTSSYVFNSEAACRTFNLNDIDLLATNNTTFKFQYSAGTLSWVPDTTGEKPAGISVLRSTTAPMVDDEYWNSLNPTQQSALLAQETELKTLLNNKYNGGDQSGEWYIRYVKNTSTGVYVPMFYKKVDVNNAIYLNGTSQSNINAYNMGSAQETREERNVVARLEKDAAGRYINITLHANDPSRAVTYSLTTNTMTDQSAYDDAMNQYEYDKYQYDQAIQEVNAKIEIVQTQDKNLELRLKQLDTEREAINTEMEAVKKVIDNNTKDTFKVFNA